MRTGYKVDFNKIIFMLIFLASASALAHENSKTVTLVTIGHVSLAGDLSLPQAKLLAINQARASAVEQANGVSVSSSTLIRDSILAGSFIESLSKGYIVEETILGWERDWHQPDDTREPPIPILRVRLKATVELPEKDFLHPYVINAKLNKSVFKSGEHATIEITPADDIYLLVANYTASDKVVPIFPNQYAKNNIFTKDSSAVLPKEDAKFSIELAVEPGSRRHTEAFLVFGFPKDRRTNSVAWLSVFPPGEALDYDEFHRRIVKLPVAWLAEKVLAYEVYQ